MVRLKPTPANSPMPRPTADGAAAPRVRRRMRVESPRAVLWTAAAVSVLLHVVLGVTMHDRLLGQVDIEAMERERTPIRVRQATFDARFDPLARPGESAERREVETTPEQISEALLAEAEQPAAREPIEQDMALREHDEARPEPNVDELAAAVDAFDVPADVWRSLAGDAPAELAYRAGDANGEGQGGGGVGAGNGSGGSGAGEAERLLAADDGLAGVRGDGAGGGGGGLSVPEAAGPSVEAGVAIDDRLLDMPLVAPEIDFAGMALDATTRLHIPEHLDHDFDYFVTRFDGEADERGYFRVDIVPRQSLRRLQTMSKDVIYLLDLTGTTPQRWADEIAGGVRQGLSTLHDGDRFNIVVLADQVGFFSGDGPLEATQENLDEARRFLDQIEAAEQPLRRIATARSSAGQFRHRLMYHIPEGQADLEAALSRLLVRDADMQRVYNLVLVSEGRPSEGVIEPRALINLITRENAGLASIFAIGIGPNADRTLLEFLTYRNRGHSLFVERRGDMATMIRGLAGRIRYPLIRDLRLHVAGSELGEVYPVVLPNVHQGERLSVFGRYDTAGMFTMRVTGNNAGNPVDFTFARDLRLAPESGRQVAESWAFWKLHHLYSEIMKRGEETELLRRIGELREAYELEAVY